MKKYNKIVLTGASGRLGSYLREPLSKISKKLVSTDKDDIGKTLKNEVFKKIKLENFNQVNNFLLYTYPSPRDTNPDLVCSLVLE